jgi:hypothetical protein
MEQLRIKAGRFRKQGRLQDEDVEEIIKEIKDKDQITNEEEGHREELIFILQYAICIRGKKKQYAYCTKIFPTPKSKWAFQFKHNLAALATAAPPPAAAEAAADGEAMVLDMMAEAETVNGAYNNQLKGSDSGRNGGQGDGDGSSRGRGAYNNQPKKRQKRRSRRRRPPWQRRRQR